MSDARFPCHWLNDRRFNRTTDKAFRTYMETLAYSVTNRTDGVLEVDDVRTVGADVIAELLKVELWTAIDKGYLIADYRTTQSSSQQFLAGEAEKAYSREYKAVDRAGGTKEEAKAAGRAAAEEVRRKTSGNLLGTLPAQGTARASARQEQGAYEEGENNEIPPFSKYADEGESSSQMPAFCSECAGPLTGPLDLAEGICAKCEVGSRDPWAATG